MKNKITIFLLITAMCLLSYSCVDFPKAENNVPKIIDVYAADTLNNSATLYAKTSAYLDGSYFEVSHENWTKPKVISTLKYNENNKFCLYWITEECFMPGETYRLKFYLGNIVASEEYTFSIPENKRLEQYLQWQREYSSATCSEQLSIVAVSSSLLPVSYRLIEGSSIAEYDESTHILTCNAPGLVKIEASQDGNENYLPATPIQMEIVIK